jgi:hypothetical protein
MLIYKCETCGSEGGNEEKPFSVPICCGKEKITVDKPSKLHSIYVMPSYQSPIDGRWIDTPRQRREDLKVHDCVEYDPSMPQEQEKRFNEEDRKFDKKVDEIVEREIYSMPGRKREKLETEVENFDMVVSRE